MKAEPSGSTTFAYYRERDNITQAYTSARVRWAFLVLALISALGVLWLRREAAVGSLGIVVVSGFLIAGVLLFIGYILVYMIGWRILLALGADHLTQKSVQACYESLQKYDDATLNHIEQMASINASVPTTSFTLSHTAWAIIIAALGWNLQNANLVTYILFGEFLLFVILGSLASVEQSNADTILKLAATELRFQRAQELKKNHDAHLLADLLDTETVVAMNGKGQRNNLHSASHN